MDRKKKHIINESRRAFLKTGGAVSAGLVLGFYLPSGCTTDTDKTTAGSFVPNAWLKVGNDDLVTITLAKSEMGQGVKTALPMLVAEELEADWSRIQVVQALANPIYGDQYTGGSASVRSSWTELRQAGATAKTMLISTAAQIWGVDEKACQAKNGLVILTTDGRELSYGKLAEKAALLPVPGEVPLKDPKDFQLIGTSISCIDTPEKVNGQAMFGLDIKLPDMLFATVLHPPVLGAKINNYNADKALKINGVRLVVKIESGIAVVAESYWQAYQGLQALEVDWEGGNAAINSENIFKKYSFLFENKGKVVYEKGDIKITAESFQTLEGIYSLPYQAHATMEPMNCTAHVHKDGCEIWAPTQHPQGAQSVAARYVLSPIERGLQKIFGKITGHRFPNIKVHTTLLGGGFGRRLENDFVAEAVQIAKAVKKPVKLIWSREQDIQHDYYRPATLNKVSAKIDQNGMPVSWHHHIVGPDWGKSVGGASSIPYAIPNIYVECSVEDTGVPIGSWRSVGSSLNAFVIESFIDEIAASSDIDPYQFRRKLLKNAPRHLAVLDLAAQKAGWGNKPADGYYQGIALHDAFNSIVAQVAVLSVSHSGHIKVHKIVCAIDCGRVVNPGIVDAQMEGGIAFGLTATLNGNITISEGRVRQSNFNDFPLLRIDEMPLIQVNIVPNNDREPGGVGETGVPPVAPAVANAVYAATGKRIRKLPIRPEDLAG